VTGGRGKWKAKEAEVKQITEEARKAEEAEQEHQAKEARKAKAVRAAKVKAKKEEAQKIRVANEAMKAGLLAIEADEKRATEEAVQLNAVALVKHWQELAKLGVPPGDTLMQAPEGPGVMI
jgi:hypothetical protein